jgi:hypothetical protein
MQNTGSMDQTVSAEESVDQVLKQTSTDAKGHRSITPGNAQESTSWIDDAGQCSEQPAPDCR